VIAPERIRVLLKNWRLADFRYEREGIQQAGMSSRACADCDQSVHAGFSGLIRMAKIDDVVEHQAAIGMDRIDHVAHRAERRDDDRHPMLNGDLDIAS
jgi:hypothetical protein